MFRFGSKKELNSNELKCSISLLEDNEVLECEFTKEHNGQYLLDYCYTKLGLEEKDYFGLRFVDSQKQRSWLDPNRAVYKQIKGLTSIVFCFRVKFYPADVDLLKDEITRYLLFLQLRRDLQHGRLHCNTTELAYLIACILQSELGDYEPNEHSESYAADMNLVPNQDNLDQTLKQAVFLHQNEMKEKTPAEVEQLFLKKASTLDSYGVDPQPVKDQKGTPLFLGVNHLGILTFQGSRKTHFFRWSEVRKVNYEGRMLIVHLMHQSHKKSYVGFKCSTVAACNYIWRCSVEHRYFFTMNSSSDVPQITTGGGFFFRQTKLHYSGRVQREILESPKSENEKGVQRSQSMMVTGSKGMIRGSNTLHPANQTIGGITSGVTLDDSVVSARYGNTSQSEPDDYRAGSETPVTSSAHRFGVRNSTPLRPNSVAVGAGGDIFHANNQHAHLHDAHSLLHGYQHHSFTTKFDLRPDLTPTESDHQPIDAPQSDESLHRPRLLNSSSARLPAVAPDLDQVNEQVDDEQFEQLSELSGQSGRKWPLDSSGGIVKQRSDSATRRKLTRQQATTSDHQSATPIITSNPVRSRVWSVFRATLVTLLLFTLIVAAGLWLFFESDLEFLQSLRQSDDAQIIHERYYIPNRQWLLNAWFDTQATITQFAAQYLTN